MAMHLLAPISEDDMVAAFLGAEIGSARFGPQLIAILERDNQPRAIIDAPDTQDPQQNAYRRTMLGETRGFGRDVDLFRGFPREVRWYRATLGKDELAAVRYIDYSYWVALSAGSRLPLDAVARIRQGVDVYGVSSADFLRLAEGLTEISGVPELILVAPDAQSPLVVLEGHVRLTVYWLRPECIPAELSVIVGLADGMRAWAFY